MKKTLVIAGILVALFLYGCSKKQSTEDVAAPVADAPDAAPAQAAAECIVSSDAVIDEAAWADANNALGLHMLAAQPGSAVISSYSAQRALGMVYEGACNATAAEIRTALSLPDAKNLSEVGAAIEKSMLEEGDERVKIRIDNRIWVEKSYPLLEDYTSRIEASYAAKPQQLDFIGDPNASRQTINDDVAKSTNDKIQNILPDGSITPTTRAVLTNAIYFKAPWKSTFNESATEKADFTTPDGKVQVDMMFHKKSHAVYVDDAFVAVELPFTNTYALTVILPTVAEGASVSDALAAVEKSLTAESIRKMRQEMSDRMTALHMPRFRIDTSASLKELLVSLGMKTAFGNDADLSRMSGNAELTISDVLQKAYIDVNENGVEAAAATAAIAMMKAMLPRQDDIIEINVDHPFLFMLTEDRTGAALFMGRVTKI